MFMYQLNAYTLNENGRRGSTMIPATIFIVHELCDSVPRSKRSIHSKKDATVKKHWNETPIWTVDNIEVHTNKLQNRIRLDQYKYTSWIQGITTGSKRKRKKKQNIKTTRREFVALYLYVVC